MTGPPARLAWQIRSHRDVAADFGEGALGEAISLIPLAPWSQRQWRAFCACGLLAITFVVVSRDLLRGEIELVQVVMALLIPVLAYLALLQILFTGWVGSLYSLAWDPEGLEVRCFRRTVRLRPGDQIEVRRPLGLEWFVRPVGGRGWVPLPGWVFEIVARRVS